MSKDKKKKKKAKKNKPVLKEDYIVVDGKDVSFTDLRKALKERFDSGHPGFIDLCFDEMQLHDLKNHDYASGGDKFGNFKRVAAICALYPNLKLDDPVVISLVYKLKQIDAVLNGLSNGHTMKVDGLPKRLEDVGVYSKLEMLMIKEQTT